MKTLFIKRRWWDSLKKNGGIKGLKKEVVGYCCYMLYCCYMNNVVEYISYWISWRIGCTRHTDQDLDLDFMVFSIKIINNTQFIVKRLGSASFN